MNRLKSLKKIGQTRPVHTVIVNIVQKSAKITITKYMIIKKYCPTCNKQANTIGENRIGGLLYQTYSCGHTVARKQMQTKDFDDFVSSDGKKPFKFQVEGALLGIKSNARFLCMDEMGLGKTIQALMIAKSDPKELCPMLVICKSKLRVQWMREVIRWCNWPAQIIDSENDYALPCKVFILSYDMLWRFKDIEAFMKRLKIKFVVMDEVQHIKNTSSKRTNGVRAACKTVDHIGALSGTPIENRTKEFFPILNILRPDKFPNAVAFEMRWIDEYWDGYQMKSAGFKNSDAFKKFTEDFIWRRTREEAMPDLPTVNRQFRFSELGEAVEEAYKAEMKKFLDYYNSAEDSESAFLRSSNILAYITKMRHLTGIAKISPVVDFIEDFATETDRKFCIFLHHRDVAKALHMRLEELRQTMPKVMGDEILMLEAGCPQDTIDRFKLPGVRFAVASTLAFSEGHNFQFCSDYGMMERQWNPSKEEQAEGRFVRIGQLSDKISGTYFVAVGTVDEFFSELVEKKRSIVANVLDGKEIKWNESDLMKDLAEILAQSGGRKWGW